MKTKRSFHFLYLLITICLLADIVAFKTFKISLAGFWSDVILYSIWVLSTLVLLLFFLRKRLAKIYFIVLTILITITLPFWVIPFLLTGLNGFQIEKSVDGKFRIENVGGLLSRPILQIIENKGLIEKVIVQDNAEFLRNNNLKIGYESISDIKFIEVTADSLKLAIKTPWRTNIVGFKIEINEQ